MLTYIGLTILLFCLELIYIKIAKATNIKDNPNHRSAHTVPTLRGGGIVFIIGIILYSIFYPITYQFLIFSIGALLVALISFVDDLITLSSKVRTLIHVTALGLLFYSLGMFSISSPITIVILIIAFILALGFLNIYNFMDGINGITFLNSFAVYGALLYINNFVVTFANSNILIILIIASLVFGFFNFRKKAICFAGDIGSITVGFTIIYFVIKLYVKTNSLLVFLLISVYLIDGGWTIIERLLRRENIFEAHKRHLYQILANNFGYNHLLISTIYFIIQVTLSCITIFCLPNTKNANGIAIVTFGLASLIYIFYKKSVLQKADKLN